MSEKAFAARVLSDEIMEAGLRLDRAETAFQEITDTFFAHDPKTERGQYAILWDFRRYSTFADMTFDYLYQLRKIVEELSALADEGRKLKQEVKLASGGDAA